MKVLSTKKPRTWTPEDQKKKRLSKQIRYTLRVPTLLDKTHFQNMCSDAGARMPQDEEWAQVLRDGARHVYEKAGRAADAELLLQLVDQYHNALDILREDKKNEPAFEIVERLRPEIQELDRQLQRVKYQPWIGLIKDRRNWDAHAKREAVRLFLVKATNLEAEIEMEESEYGDIVTADSLELIPLRHWDGLAIEAMEMLTVSEAERKNSSSLPDGSAAKTTSRPAANATAPGTPAPKGSGSKSPSLDSSSTIIPSTS